MDVIQLKKQLSVNLLNMFDTIFQNHGLNDNDIFLLFEYPPEREFGDLALPCFRFGKIFKKSPVQIAQIIKDNFQDDNIIKTEAVNGFLNFYIKYGYYINEVMPGILTLKEKYGNADTGDNKTVVLDYSSPNVAKPFHIGHIGTTIIGHSLRLLHEKAGYKCIGINYLGDWGTQFGKLIAAYNLWGDKQKIIDGGIDELVDLYVRFHSEAEKDSSLEEKARNDFLKLEQGDAGNIALWKWFIEISLTEYEKTYDQLNIKFDSYSGESHSYKITKPVIDELKEKGLLKKDGGAELVYLDEYKMPPCMILKSDGSTIYASRDIAEVLSRKKTYNFDKAVYVTSAAQSLYFAQLFKVVELMGYEWAKEQLIHVPYGTFSVNGEKLSTRSGNVVLLKDLFRMAIEKVREIIDEKNPGLIDKEETAEAVGVGAVVFHYLMNNRIKDVNFILEDALNFDGNTGPYAQYTYARTCSILEKGRNTDIADEFNGYVPCAEEMNVLRILYLYPEKIAEALKEYEPSVITRYIIDICVNFNRFYHECQIINAEKQIQREFRIRLTNAVNIILKDALNLICLKTPEKI